MVVAADGADARPGLCVRTAELYLDVEPRSRSDAGRLYARACKLGDDASCSRAKSLNVEVEAPAAVVAPKASPTRTAPPATPTVSSPPPKPCHEMRACVMLDVKQRNTTEVVGTLTNRCERPVSCTWCPSRNSVVEKATCRTSTLAPGESKSGREGGLWYEGYNAIAYDCMDADDERSCNAM
jgi:hypothetical protein